MGESQENNPKGQLKDRDVSDLASTVSDKHGKGKCAAAALCNSPPPFY